MADGNERWERVYVIGVGDDGAEGLSSRARQLVAGAELVISDDDSLESLTPATAVWLRAAGNLEAIVERIAENDGRRIVVLTGGDPLFYGTARFLCDRLGKQRFEVIPHVSSMQLAFARVKESWDDAYLVNLATQPLERVVERIRTAEKVGLFTTEQVSPAMLARRLLDRGLDYFTGYVCENLGAPDERVTSGELAELSTHEFAPLNVMILVRKPHVPDRPTAMRGRRLFGNPDERFLQSHPKRGLLTPAEVRSMALAEMDLGPTSVVWDVGAGSGSVAIEAAQIASGGQVFAIEMDPDDYRLIAANAERFQVANLTAVLGRAPEAWQDLPDPDAVFVGGTGRQIAGLAELAFERLRRGGRLVANVGSVDSLANVRESLRQNAGDVDVWMINVARGTDQLERLRFEALNPTFLVAAVKP